MRLKDVFLTQLENNKDHIELIFGGDNYTVIHLFGNNNAKAWDYEGNKVKLSAEDFKIIEETVNSRKQKYKQINSVVNEIEKSEKEIIKKVTSLISNLDPNSDEEIINNLRYIELDLNIWDIKQNLKNLYLIKNLENEKSA